MTTMDRVKKIEAEIAALPAEYRPLVTKADAWEARHVALALAVAFAAGFVAAIVAQAAV